MKEPLCAACLLHGRGATPAVAFTRARDWRVKEFVPGAVYPLCQGCFNKRYEMSGPDPLGMPWEEGLAEWQILQIHES